MVLCCKQKNIFGKIDDRLCHSWIARKISKVISHIELNTMRYYQDKAMISMIRGLMKEEGDLFFKPSEVFMIYSLALSRGNIEGDYAEVGVYRGASAKIICEAKDDKHLYLFDTFEGLPQTKKTDNRFSRVTLRANYEYVIQRLSVYKNVHIYKGIFPKTADPIKDKKFAFVHLDVDLYQSSLDCLDFFYKRTQRGGIILSHDYAKAEGVKRAFDEFFTDKSEDIIRLPMTQCMVIKN
ncbi:MAG: class I SAM-dependent methyltransferase [Candidatus Omnitrophica bacterium]|nr:class I SAM-dependent methyltransferase [Candidatus Omnitrophota bacterium]